MNMLASLKSDDTIANEKDVLGGNAALESDAYPAKITAAYLQKSEGGALGLFLRLQTEDKKEIRQTLWATSGDAKGNKNYYEKDGQKNYLPGFLMANSLALLTVGKEISELETESKVINVYSKDAGAEVPTKVDMLMDLVNQEIIAGLIKQTVDKNAKNEATGKFEPTGDTREENEVDKFFRAKDKMTTAELRAQATEPKFYDQWVTKNKGVSKNKAKGVAGANGTAGAPKAAGTANTKPKQSLFA